MSVFSLGFWMMSDKNNKSLDYWWGAGLGLFLKLSSWIVAPVLAGVWIGKKIDAKFETEPRFFLITVGVAFIISIAGMIISALKELKKINSENEKNKK